MCAGGGVNLQPCGYFCVCLPGFGVRETPCLMLGGFFFFFFNMMEDYKHGALKKLQNHVHTVPRRWGRGDRGRAGHQGRGQSFPAGCRMRRGGAIILNNKMCGAAGGRWKAGFFYYYYYFIFRSGQDYLAARLETEEEKGTAAERV